ncbi:MAG: DegV family protein [Clostridia bacterium]|nr:DegV family protein [Clostridia bacterium]
MSFSIITDSTANLKKSFLSLNGIKTIEMPYFINGKEYTCTDLDGFDDKTYYENIRKGTVVSTSQINPQQIADAFEAELEAGKDLIFIGLSSGLSGSFKSARMAKAELEEKYSQRKIFLLDSLGAALGIGLCVFFADMYRKKGFSAEETFEAVSKIRDRMYQVFIVDDLMHFKRTGRLSNVSAAVGCVLGIKPILKGNAQGKIVATEKIRGRKQAVTALARKCFKLIKDTDVIGITYADCKEDAMLLKKCIEEKISPKRFIIEKHKPVTGSHIGPGALALYFVGNENVRNM